MLQQAFILIGSCIFVVLGTMHGYLTFFSNRFSARDEQVEEGMKNTSPVLTNQTTMWKAWISFNGTHSLGVMFLGLINILLLALYPSVIVGQLPVLCLDALICLCYLYIALNYWFGVPKAGTIICNLCFMAALLCTLFGITV